MSIHEAKRESRFGTFRAHRRLNHVDTTLTHHNGYTGISHESVDEAIEVFSRQEKTADQLSQTTLILSGITFVVSSLELLFSVKDKDMSKFKKAIFGLGLGLAFIKFSDKFDKDSYIAGYKTGVNEELNTEIENPSLIHQE